MFIFFLVRLGLRPWGSSDRIRLSIPHQSFCSYLNFCSDPALGHWFQLFFSYPRTINFVRTLVDSWRTTARSRCLACLWQASGVRAQSHLGQCWEETRRGVGLQEGHLSSNAVQGHGERKQGSWFPSPTWLV